MKKRISFLLFLIVLGSSEFMQAQNFNLSSPPIDEKMSVGLKYNRVLFKEDVGLSTLSGVYKFYGNFSLGKNWQINAELPLVVVSWKDNDYSDNETGLANIFLEFQKALNQDKTTYLNFGIFLPTIGSEHYERMFVGILSDIYRYLQYTEGFTFQSTFGYNLKKTPGPIFGVELGPDIFIPTSESGETVEFLIHYGLKGGYKFNAISAYAEFSGMWIISEEGELADNSLNQLFLGAQSNKGTFRPGFFYGFHINKDLREETSGIIGLNFQVVF